MTGSTAARGDWKPRWQQLARAVLPVHTPQGERQLIDSFSRPAQPLVLAFVNAHAMNCAAESASFFNAVSAADVVLRDGIGMAMLLRLLQQPPGMNLNGTDFIPKLLRSHAGRPIALFGTEEPFLSRAHEAVVSRIAPGSSCVAAHGFLDTAQYVRLAAAHRPSLIVLGMGMPRQEEVAAVLRAALAHPCLIVCGGAIIDFLGGKTSRAPAWMRGMGFEWAFRLALEPKRLFKRYVIGNPVFIARAVSLAAGPAGRDRGAAT